MAVISGVVLEAILKTAGVAVQVLWEASQEAQTSQALHKRPTKDLEQRTELLHFQVEHPVHCMCPPVAKATAQSPSREKLSLCQQLGPHRRSLQQMRESWHSNQMSKVAYGVTKLQGTTRVDIKGIERLDATCIILFRALGTLTGMLVRTEITAGDGFGLFSTSEEDDCEVKWEVWTTPLPPDDD